MAIKPKFGQKVVSVNTGKVGTVFGKDTATGFVYYEVGFDSGERQLLPARGLRYPTKEELENEKKKVPPIGSKVKMVNCWEADEHKGKVWTVASEPWDVCGSTVVKLEGKRGGFDASCLEVVKPLKAYQVTRSDEEYSVIVFAETRGQARSFGAAELDRDFMEVLQPTRAPWADQYAEAGKVPIEALLEHGWWHECCDCMERVYEDDLKNGAKIIDGGPVCAKCVDKLEGKK